MTGLSVTDVRKTYRGGFEAVKGVTFTVADGALCVLVGPSGCGKSTLLRMIAGLETISSGDIRIGARRVNEREPMDRDVAMVFQNYALYPHMSVYDNMAYGLRNLRTPKAEIDARVQEAARILELDAGMLRRQPRQLSGGQRQRVAMGRAIVRKPALFLFDEPLSNLDAKLRVQMRVEIRKLQRRLATTSVYVTHDQSEAMTLADMLVVMNQGHVEQAGAPLAIYERPASRFVAGFIGSPPMNFLNGTVVVPGRVRLDGGVELAYDVSQFRAAVGQVVVAGIRPEHVVLGGAVKLAIEVVEELGAERLIHGRLADTPFTVAQRADAPPPSAPTLALDLPPARINLFDAGTGMRVDNTVPEGEG